MSGETHDAETPALELTLSRVGAAKELLRLERRIERAENALRLLTAHRERLLGLIGGGGT